MKKYQHYIGVQGEVLLNRCGTITAIASWFLTDNYNKGGIVHYVFKGS